MARNLTDHLRALIEREGPISVATYMAKALGNPEWGYYQTREPFGRAGDFTTAPEISQMYGELIGLWCAQTWLDLDSPKPFNLVELGPGRGTLIVDALRALKVMPECIKALQLHLIETSPKLRQRQQELIASHAPNIPVHWHDSFQSVPKGPLILVANEFFDALPIRQFVKTTDGWHERLVGLHDDGVSLKFGLSQSSQAESKIPKAHRTAKAGQISEICPQAVDTSERIAKAIRDNGGSAIIIDYGPARSVLGDSLQAVKAHKFVDVLDDPGTADLTAHLDFEALGNVAAEVGLNVFGPQPQRAFLHAMGIETRARKLSASANKDERIEIATALRRLTGGNAMGDLFKVLVLTSAKVVPAGF